MSPLSRRLLPIAAIFWPACIAGLRLGPAAAPAGFALLGVALIVRSRWPLVLTVALSALLGALAGVGGSVAEARRLGSIAGERRVVRMLASVATDPESIRFGTRLVVVPIAYEQESELVPWKGPPLEVRTEDARSARFGDRVVVEGLLQAGRGRVGRHEVAGRLTSAEVVDAGLAEPVLIDAANRIRDRVLSGIDLSDSGQALLAGFLVGDTSGVGDADLEALRRAGLTHYVAVSGSNVATFLALWWLVLAPFARHPVARAVSGVVGVTIFVVVTRAEPSVVRAGVMVGLLLLGRLFGLALDRWSTLATTVLVCLSFAPGLADDVGFQLSAAATAGVMAGTTLFTFRPRPVAQVLGATVSAQVAVAPILLGTFGSIPLMSPIANLVAAPLVSLSTAVGGIGALTHGSTLVRLGDLAAEAVLFIGRLSAPWPQLGWAGTFAVVAMGLVAWKLPALRPVVVVLGGLLVVAVLLPIGPSVRPGTVVFLDVGQGDASLVFGEDVVVLIDGGPDPGLLAEKLADWGVDRVDLLVVSHVHADHIEGLRAVVGRLPVGSVWLAFDHQSTPASEWLRGALATAAIPSTTPPPGSHATVGGLDVVVLGPLRRYASPNDQSIVLRVEMDNHTVLFTGDIEVIAQQELAGVRADVLKVPHQGAATSDADWLASVGPRIASISVGPNTFGHPADWVIDVLEDSGAVVMRTDRDGDVVVGPDGMLSEGAHAWPPW